MNNLHTLITRGKAISGNYNLSLFSTIPILFHYDHLSQQRVVQEKAKRDPQTHFSPMNVPEEFILSQYYRQLNHFLTAAFLFFFFPFILACLSYFAINFTFSASSLFKNSSHSSFNCFLLASVFSSIASCLSFFVCSFNNNTPEISSSLLILFLSMNSLYLSSSWICLFSISLSSMQITSLRSMLGLPSRSRRIRVLLVQKILRIRLEHYLFSPVLVRFRHNRVSFLARASTRASRGEQSYLSSQLSRYLWDQRMFQELNLLSSRSMNLMESFSLRSRARQFRNQEVSWFPSNYNLSRVKFLQSFSQISLPSTSESSFLGIDSAFKLELDSTLFTNTLICAGLRFNPEMVNSRLVDCEFKSLIICPNFPERVLDSSSSSLLNLQYSILCISLYSFSFICICSQLFFFLSSSSLMSLAFSSSCALSLSCYCLTLLISMTLVVLGSRTSTTLLAFMVQESSIDNQIISLKLEVDRMVRSRVGRQRRGYCVV